MERSGVITFQGNPLTLLGPALKPGDKAPAFSLLDAEMKPFELKDLSGKIKLISVTPSLDTPVCDLQLRRFNTEAAGLPGDVMVLNVSMDLPFAIARFCTSAGIDRAKALSDYRDAAFGLAYGVLIKELRLLARAIFILDRSDLLRYIEIVPEITNQPDYEKAVTAAKQIL
ncbi:MAG: thiol peroxidase [Nitrospirota bacterium]|nr:thiol peroxidase [Nitrospirota bacterium]